MAQKEKLPVWDLSKLYSNIGDEKLARDSEAALKMAAEFRVRNYQKVRKAKPDAWALTQAIKEYESILAKAIRPYLYAELEFRVATQSEEVQRVLQRMQLGFTQVTKELSWFPLVFAKLSSGVWKKLAETPELKDYVVWIEKIRLSRDHFLSEEAERVLSEKSLTSNAAWQRLYDQHTSRYEVAFSESGKKKIVSLQEALEKLHEPNRALRKRVAAAITKTLQRDIREPAYVFNTLIQDKAGTDRLRGFEHAPDSRHIDNEMSGVTVDMIEQVVVGKYSLVHDYYRLKAKILKQKELTDIDRYVLPGEVSQQFSWDEARNLVLDSFGSFSKKIQTEAKLFFDKKWIHAPVVKGKAGGAFCMYVTPKDHPLVMVNYVGNVRSVFTLAHELGHGVNGRLARKQSILNFDWPLPIAETASLYAEMLLYQNVKQSLESDSDRLVFAMMKIEEIFASVFRQMAMYRFEKKVHEHGRSRGELSYEDFNSYWRITQAEMFGDALTLTTDYDSWWSYIPHFVHTPFYVYAYSIGQLLALGFSQLHEERGKDFVKQYEDFLAAGGSLMPHDLLGRIGVDMASPDFWHGAFRSLEQLIAEVQELHE